MTQTFPKLTKLEREILNHRLGVADALVEVFTDEGFGFDESGVYKTCDLLIAGDWESASKLPPFAEVLADAVEGSTFLGAGEGVESDQKQAAVYRAGESLAKKIGDFIGRKLEYPTC